MITRSITPGFPGDACGRPMWFERAGDQHGPAFTQAPLQTQEFCRQFAHGIRVARIGRLQLSNGQVVFADLAVDIPGADVQESTHEPARLEGLQQVQGAQHIDVQRTRRVPKRFGYERLAGQLDHRIGHLRPQAFEAVRLAEVVARRDRQQLPSRGIGQKARLDVLSYKSSQTRNEQTFFQTATPWSCISSISTRFMDKPDRNLLIEGLARCFVLVVW